jgi:thiol-disulfide isomerase/thioredoxin
MKTFIVQIGLCLSIFLLTSLSAQSATRPTDEPSGIKFFKGSWKDVLAEAKRQNKPIFVDIFTTWCGPCKLMAKQAFPDVKVGEKFNANFVSYQIDAEKGEGPVVAKNYTVDAFPTSLYVSATGDLIHRAVGYGGIKGMMDEADKAIEAAKDPNPLSAMEKQYANGNRDTDFLAAYLQKRANVSMPNGAALTDYLKTIPESDWTSAKTIPLIAGNATLYDQKVQKLLLEKLIQMKGAAGEQAQAERNKVAESVFRLNQAHYEQAIARKDETIIADVIATNEAYLNAARGTDLTPDEAREMANGYRMRYYQKTGSMDKYTALMKKQADALMQYTEADFARLNEAAYQSFEQQTRALPDSVKQSDNFKNYAAMMKKAEPKQTAMKLNNMAWSYYENITDKKDLSQALSWSAKSLEYDRSAMCLDTYAHLLSKLGRKAEAINVEEEAVAKEKAAGGDPASYAKELAKMKQK